MHPPALPASFPTLAYLYKNIRDTRQEGEKNQDEVGWRMGSAGGEKSANCSEMVQSSNPRTYEKQKKKPRRFKEQEKKEETMS